MVLLAKGASTNNWLFRFINDNDKYTLPIYLLNLQSGLYGTVDFGALNADLVISILPSIIIFLLLQRYYINGLVAGAVK
jgi:multiple sugar transport system permease protein